MSPVRAGKIAIHPQYFTDLYKVWVMDFVLQCMKMHQNVAFPWKKLKFSGEGTSCYTHPLVSLPEMKSQLHTWHCDSLSMIMCTILPSIFDEIMQKYSHHNIQFILNLCEK